MLSYVVLISLGVRHSLGSPLRERLAQELHRLAKWWSHVALVWRIIQLIKDPTDHMLRRKPDNSFIIFDGAKEQQRARMKQG